MNTIYEYNVQRTKTITCITQDEPNQKKKQDMPRDILRILIRELLGIDNKTTILTNFVDI